MNKQIEREMGSRRKGSGGYKTLKKWKTQYYGPGVRTGEKVWTARPVSQDM